MCKKHNFRFAGMSHLASLTKPKKGKDLKNCSGGAREDLCGGISFSIAGRSSKDSSSILFWATKASSSTTSLRLSFVDKDCLEDLKSFFG